MGSKFISKKTKIGNNVYIGDNVKIYGETVIESGVVIEDNCIIGKHSTKEIQLFRNNYKNKNCLIEDFVKQKTIIGKDCYIGYGSNIFSGAKLNPGVEVEEYVRIGANSNIGMKTRIMYRALIYNRVTIGKSCKISGFICNETVLYDNVDFFGKTVHKYDRYTMKVYNKSPIIKNNVIIGFDAIIIGDVTIGEKTIIAPGVVITKSVADSTIIFGNY